MCSTSFNSLQTGTRSQRLTSYCFLLSHHLFQFPSNGKADTKKDMYRDYDKEFIGFQFPSNGKAEPKDIPTKSANTFSVSIPFKRESGAKESQQMAQAQVELAFQFPSNGNADTKFFQEHAGISPNRKQSFNSLQTGTRIQSPGGGSKSKSPGQNVSIPFKRERGYKASQRCGGSPSASCFNSLQTGTRIQRFHQEVY